MRVATVFSGVGAIEQACKSVYGEDNVQIVFACDTGERYLKETKDFLLGMIVPVIAFTLSLLIPVDTPFRLLTGVFLGLIFFMILLFSIRLISVSDNKEENDIKRDGYKFKYKPIKLSADDFKYWITNAVMPETIYVKSALKVNYKFMVDYETQGKNGPFINKRFYLDNKELKDEKECVKVFQELSIIFDDYITKRS